MSRTPSRNAPRVGSFDASIRDSPTHRASGEPERLTRAEVTRRTVMPTAWIAAFALGALRACAAPRPPEPIRTGVQSGTPRERQTEGLRLESPRELALDPALRREGMPDVP